MPLQEHDEIANRNVTGIIIKKRVISTSTHASGSFVPGGESLPFTLTIERGLEIMAEDEYLEITPDNVRLRKQPGVKPR